MVYTPVPGRSKQNGWPLLAICCLGLVAFLIAATIVLALIPVYLPHKDVVQPTIDNDDTFYLQYSGNGDGSNSASGTLLNKDQLANTLGLGSDAKINEAYTQATYTRRKRGIYNRRRKRQIVVKVLLGCIYVYKSTCTTDVCKSLHRTKLKKKIQTVGNIASFPCNVLFAGQTISFTLSTTFLGFISASTARLGFGAVDSLTFRAIKSGAFNDPTIWANGIVPFSKCNVIIPVGITVTIARAVFEVAITKITVYGILAIGTGSSTFKFTYSINLIIASGGVCQFLTSTPRILVPPSSIITVYTGGSFSVTGVIIQVYTSSGEGTSTTLTTASGPITCGILADGTVLTFYRVTFIVAKSGGFTSSSTWLGGDVPTADLCTGGCGLYIPSGCTLDMGDLNGVLNINFAVITVASGGVLILGVSGSSIGFRFKYVVQLDVYGTLSFVGTTGAGIYIPVGSVVNFYPGSSFTSTVVTFIQAYDTSTGNNVGTALVLSVSFSGPYYVTIGTDGTITVSFTTPGTAVYGGGVVIIISGGGGSSSSSSTVRASSTTHVSSTTHISSTTHASSTVSTPPATVAIA